jgi:lysophospholipase L1-like esterase
MRNFLFWVLFPFVIPQAYLFRKNAPRFHSAKGDKTGSIGIGSQYRLIAIGDSIIAGVGASTLDKALVGQTASSLATSLSSGVDWAAIGKVGITSKGIMQKLIPELPESEAQFIVLSVGVNDVTSLEKTSAFRKKLHEIIHGLVQHSPSAIIAVAGIPPLQGFPLLPQPLGFILGLRGKMFDEIIKEVAMQYERVVHVPLTFDPSPEKFSADGFHPSEESYIDFGSLVAERIISHQKKIHSTMRAT